MRLVRGPSRVVPCVGGPFSFVLEGPYQGRSKRKKNRPLSRLPPSLRHGFGGMPTMEQERGRPPRWRAPRPHDRMRPPLDTAREARDAGSGPGGRQGGDRGKRHVGGRGSQPERSRLGHPRHEPHETRASRWPRLERHRMASSRTTPSGLVSNDAGARCSGVAPDAFVAERTPREAGFDATERSGSYRPRTSAHACSESRASTPPRTTASALLRRHAAHRLGRHRHEPLRACARRHPSRRLANRITIETRITHVKPYAYCNA